MKKEYSAGIVVYRQGDSGREYLLLHYAAGHWDLPKGHIEAGETKQQAAHRELKEETGLSATLIDGFEHNFSYFLQDYKTKKPIDKTVFFFIGKTNEKNIVLSDEHKGYMWLAYRDALEQLTYKNAKELLHKSEMFLDNADTR